MCAHRAKTRFCAHRHVRIPVNQDLQIVTIYLYLKELKNYFELKNHGWGVLVYRTKKERENITTDAHNPQPGEIAFNTMKYRKDEKVQR